MDEILINTSTLGSQEQPAIAGFRGTQFVAVWEDRQDGNIKGQMLSTAGNKTSGEFVVHTPRESARKDYIGNAADDGRLATVFAQLVVAGERQLPA